MVRCCFEVGAASNLFLLHSHSYFPKTKIDETASGDEVDSVAANIPADAGTSDAMAAYTAAISKDLKVFK